MRTVIRIIGSVVTAGGAALLAYVAVTYYRGNSHPAAHHWTATQRATGSHLASQLSHGHAFAAPHEIAAVQPRNDPATRMVIPKIEVDAPVVQTPPVAGVWEVADWSVGHLSTTPNPGVAGNGAYAAHDDIKGEIFKRINELAPGDKILMFTHHAVVTYVVTKQLTVDPSNLAPLNPTAQPTITLISCAPYWVDTQRLIVQAREKSRSVL
jgi:LPXTG-site transpeptidase (sortase) family protein